MWNCSPRYSKWCFQLVQRRPDFCPKHELHTSNFLFLELVYKHLQFCFWNWITCCRITTIAYCSEQLVQLLQSSAHASDASLSLAYLIIHCLSNILAKKKKNKKKSVESKYLAWTILNSQTDLISVLTAQSITSEV